MKNRRFYVSLVITLFITLISSVIFTILGFQMGFGNKRVLINTMNESTYFRKLGEDLNEKFIKECQDYHVPTELVSDLWPQNQIYKDISNHLKSRFYQEVSAEETPRFVLSLRDEFINTMKQYYEEYKPCDITEWNKTTEELAQIFEWNYKQAFQLPLIDQFLHYKDLIKSYSIWLYAIGGSIIVLLTIVLFYMYFHKYKSLSFLFSGITGGAIVSLLIILVAQRNFKIESGYLADAQYDKLCSFIIQNGFDWARFGGIIGLSIAFLILCASYFLYKENW